MDWYSQAPPTAVQACRRRFAFRHAFLKKVSFCAWSSSFVKMYVNICQYLYCTHLPTVLFTYLLYGTDIHIHTYIYTYYACLSLCLSHSLSLSPSLSLYIYIYICSVALVLTFKYGPSLKSTSKPIFAPGVIAAVLLN